MTTKSTSPTLASDHPAFAEHSILVNTRFYLNRFIDSLTDDELYHPATPGGNHTLWTMGHLALADEFFLKEMGGIEGTLATEWAESFSWGKPCNPDETIFPTVTEVRSSFDATRSRILEYVTSLTLEDLKTETAEQWREFAPNTRAMLMGIACHESTHTGQIIVVRKSLGKEILSM